MAKTQQAAKKYKDLLSQSQQEKDQLELSFRVEEAQHKLSADLLSTKRSLAEANLALMQAKSNYPLYPQDVINAQLRVEGLEDGIRRLEALQTELF